MNEPLRAATLLFLRKNGKILLAMKKRGFGAGRWNGVGGKPEPNEAIRDTAIRETQEEIGVTPVSFHEVATLNFFFPPQKTDWNQRVHVYVCSKWDGEPIESEEMAPKWYDEDTVPYNEMWSDDKFWLPEVLTGKYVNADFYFEEDDNEIIRQHVTTRPLDS
jgi:8-oxo-dGTP pyrophosphatase MutT (NUDIX family)